MTQAYPSILPSVSTSSAAPLTALGGFESRVGCGASLQAGTRVWSGRTHWGHAAQCRIRTGSAVIGGVRLTMAVQVAVDILHRRELFWADRTSGETKRVPNPSSKFQFSFPHYWNVLLTYLCLRLACWVSMCVRSDASSRQISGQWMHCKSALSDSWGCLVRTCFSSSSVWLKVSSQ